MRKKIKSIISLLICLGLLFSVSQFSAVFASQQTSAGAYEQNATESKALISALLADSTLHSDLSAPATRGEFLTTLMTLMNLISPYGPQSGFEDIPAGTELGNAANFAVATGIVSPAQKFNPGDQVTYAQAAKMTVEALGCGLKAQALGGYPYGYTRLAAENELDSGISGNEKLTVGDMYIMLANLCGANAYTFVSFEYSQGVINYNLKEGKPFMEVYLNISKAIGVVDAANGSYLHDSSTYFESGCASVNDVVYSLADGVECSLGMNVEIFYTNEGSSREEIIHVRPVENKVSVVSYKNSPEFSGDKVTFFNESGKEQKLSIDSLAAILYNGRADGSISASDFEIEAGYIEAIDNDDDGVYEVLSIWEPEYLEVGAVNIYDNIIYDVNYKTNIMLDDNDITAYCDKEIESYNAGDVLEVYVSNDGKYVKLSTIKNNVSGVVTAYGSNGEIYIDDVKYTTHPYFDEFYRKNVELSKSATFVVNSDGLIVSAKLSGISEFTYAYFDVIKKKDGLSPEVLIKLYSQNDEILETKLAEKIRLNGSSKTAAEAYDLISDLTGTIIRYQADGEGMITAINTIMDNEGVYEPVSDGYDVVKRYRFPGDETETLVYYKTSGYFVPHFTINTSTAIFCVSPDTNLDDDERFSMAKTLTFLDNDERVASNTLKVYNVADTGCAEVLLYSAKVEDDVNIDYAPFGIVAECSQALDPDGDAAFKVVLYSGDSYVTKYVDEDASFIKDMNLANGEVPFNMGDVIRYTESGGRITNAAKDFDGETKTLLNTTGDNKMVHYYYGKIYAIGTSSIAILKDDGSIAYVPYSIKNVCLVDEKDVYTAPKGVIATYKQAGDNATKILVKCRYSAVAQVYMFK